jgi:STE24 endopeptidase
MNPYLAIILAALLGRWLLELAADLLNLRHVSEALPPEFAGRLDVETYRRSQRYLRDNTRLGMLTDAAFTLLTVAFILAGGFNLVDRAARGFGLGSIPTGLIFTGMLALGARIVTLPFSVYDTFVIEERYGFNKTTPRTFVWDEIKALAVGAVIGGAALAVVLWLFEKAGPWAWVYGWGALLALQIVLVYLAPFVIMPLFNKFTPLGEGNLRSTVEDYARAQSFRMRGVFTMDGSRRSSKTNAFFTGFGGSRRIVLFDTLIAKHPVPELVAVVAHEMGHHKRWHILQALVRSAVSSGATFFVLSLFIGNSGIFKAFRVEQVSIYGSLVFFGFLYAPIGMAIGLIENAISRRHEYQADAYAVASTGNGEAMVAALQQLSVDNLSNLTPHPLKVALSYSHPPVLERIRAIRRGREEV